MFYDNVDFNRLKLFLEKIKNDEVYEEDITLDCVVKSTLDISSSFINQLSYYLPKKDVDVLDIGCGYGTALELFKKRGYNAVGITIGDIDYKRCKEKGFNVLLMDQSFLTFQENSFDLIWCRHTLEHSIMPYFTLDGFFKVNKNNGYLYVEVPLSDIYYKHQENKNHYSILTKSAWCELVKKVGYNIVDTTTITLNAVDDAYDYFYLILAKKEIK